MSFFFFTGAAPPEIYTLSLHDALPISLEPRVPRTRPAAEAARAGKGAASERSPHPSRRSEEHTSELQSRGHLVCRLLLEKKKKTKSTKKTKNTTANQSNTQPTHTTYKS